MYRIVLIVVFLAGAIYLYSRRSSGVSEQPRPEPPPTPPVLQHFPPLVLSEMEIQKIRLATMDGDPQVRWAAIDLLYRVRDPQIYEILQKTLKIDSEPGVRRKSLDILKKVNSPDRIPVLIGALNDTERNIRIAALVALGEVADPKATTAIIKALRDTDPIVRRQALNTLGVIQTKMDLQHKEMQEKVRQEYEKALDEHKRKTKGLTAPLPVKHKDLLEENKVE